MPGRSFSKEIFPNIQSKSPFYCSPSLSGNRCFQTPTAFLSCLTPLPQDPHNTEHRSCQGMQHCCSLQTHLACRCSGAGTALHSCDTQTQACPHWVVLPWNSCIVFLSWASADQTVNAQGYEPGGGWCSERKENLNEATRQSLSPAIWDSEVKVDWILTVTLFKKSRWWDGKTKYFPPSVDVLSLMESYPRDLLAPFPYVETAEKLSCGVLRNLLVQMLALCSSYYHCTSHNPWKKYWLKCDQQWGEKLIYLGQSWTLGRSMPATIASLTSAPQLNSAYLSWSLYYYGYRLSLIISKAELLLRLTHC